MTPSPTFCILPWIHVFADEAGILWPCCRAVGSRRPNLRDADGQPYPIGDGLRAGMDTASMRALRREMMAGLRPKACERCYMVEDLGICSHRQSENAHRSAEIPQLLAATGEDGALRVELRSADLRLGNVCNLRCRMCSPQSSRALIPEWAAFHKLPNNHHYFDAYRQLDWFDRPEFWDMLENEAPGLERINFGGGEPLLIGRMFDFLERMVANGRSKAITISYNTNLTVLPERVPRLWPAFKSVRVTTSIDGFGAINDFIRFPSHWHDIDRNLRTLNAKREQLNLGAGLSTNVAVQVYNVFHLGQLLDYIATELPGFEVPNLSIVSYPEYLCLRILPPALKARASECLRAVVAHSSDLWRGCWGAGADGLIAAIEGIIEHMNNEDRSQLLPQFLRWTRHQDSFRGQSTAALIPELAPLFGE